MQKNTVLISMPPAKNFCKSLLFSPPSAYILLDSIRSCLLSRSVQSFAILPSYTVSILDADVT